MRKEAVGIIATAGVFFAVGFLAGYITDAQMHWNPRQRAAQTSTAAEMPGGGATSVPSGEAMPQGLPEGHPPIDSAAIIKQMEDMAAENPKDVDARLRLANFLYDQKQYTQAIAWYERVLELDPKNVGARTDLGTAFFYTGRPQDALREYRQSLQIDPKHEPTLLNTIIVNLEGTHDLAAAEKAWTRLHELNPNHPALAGLKEKLDAAQAAGRTGVTR
jgi:cytochrome c-type biogenesis protein CcmH/NrfG